MTGLRLQSIPASLVLLNYGGIMGFPVGKAFKSSGNAFSGMGWRNTGVTPFSCSPARGLCDQNSPMERMLEKPSAPMMT